MSFVLDALEKAEQDKLKSQSPMLHQRSYAGLTKQNARWPVALLAGLLLLSGALIGYLLWEKGTGLTQLPDESKPAAASSEAASHPGIDHLAANGAQARLSLGYPQQLKRSLATVKLTSHVWASSAAERFLLVEGNMLRKDDWLADQLQIVEIMESGVLVRYQGAVYRVPIDDLWAGGKP